MTQNPTDRRRKLLLLVGISYFSFVILGLPTATMIGVAWPHMRDDFQLAQDGVGVLYITVSIAYFVASFISGRLVTRFGIAPPLIASAVIAALGYIGYSLSPSWGLIVLLGFVTGFGGGLLDSGTNILFAANYGPRLMNWLHASFGVGAIIGPLMMTAIIQNGASWKLGYVITAILYVLLALLFIVTRKNWMVSGHEMVAAERPGAPPAATLRLVVVWLLIGLFLIYSGLESSAGQWAFSLFTESRHVNEAVAGVWISIYGGSFTAGRIFFGFIVNRFQKASMIRVCLVAMITGMIVLWWNPTPVVGYIGLLVFGFTLAPIFALMITTTQDRLGPLHAPNAIGFEIAAASIGVGLLTEVAGVLAKNTGLEVIPPFFLVFSILMAVFYEAIISPRVAVPITPAAVSE